MKTSKKGLDIIKKYEGFRNAPYLCPANVPTIGFGSTFYEDGSRIMTVVRNTTTLNVTTVGQFLYSLNVADRLIDLFGKEYFEV